MFLILDLGSKTVVEINYVFHVWNLWCYNLFVFFLEKRKRIELKPFVQNVLGGGRNVMAVFFSSSLLQ